MTLHIVQIIIEWSAILCCAMAGIFEARERDMDFVGAFVIASACAFGGGTVRDLLLDRHPLFWLQKPEYVIVVFLITFFSMFITLRKSPGLDLLVNAVDALALGFFSFLGTFYALKYGTNLFVAPLIGVVTGVFGGIIRDVFFAEVPRIYRKGGTTLYTVCSFTGCCVYLALRHLEASGTVGFIACTLVTFLFRMAAVRFNWSLRV
jgi:uncharacterized membrane protein YeiH